MFGKLKNKNMFDKSLEIFIFTKNHLSFTKHNLKSVGKSFSELLDIPNFFDLENCPNLY